MELNLWGLVAPIGLLCLVLMVTWIGLQLAIKSFWKKKVDTEYVTVDTCRDNRAACGADREASNKCRNAEIKVLNQSVAGIRKGLVLWATNAKDIDKETKDKIVEELL